MSKIADYLVEQLGLVEAGQMLRSFGTLFLLLTFCFMVFNFAFAFGFVGEDVDGTTRFWVHVCAGSFGFLLWLASKACFKQSRRLREED